MYGHVWPTFVSDPSKYPPAKVDLQGFGGNLLEAAAGGISVVSSFHHGLSVTIP